MRADVYAGGASELVTGRLLRRLISRDEAVVATKVFYPTTGGPNGAGLSRKHILAAIDASLRRLQMDYVDLYQVHRANPETPIEETMEALHDVVRSGKARYLGASTMPASRFARAQAVAERQGWTRFVSMQNHYNLLYREEEREMIPLCVDQRVAVLPYSPLARGLLAKSQSAASTVRAASDPLRTSLYGQPGDEEVIDCVRQLAKAHATSPAQIALSWLIHRPGVTASVIGATTTSHIDTAVDACDLVLDGADLSRLQNVYRPFIPDPDLATGEPSDQGRRERIQTFAHHSAGDLGVCVGRPSRTMVGHRGPIGKLDGRAAVLDDETIYEEGACVSEAESLFGAAHVQRYRETEGEVGHLWKRGAKTLLLTTKGRKTGNATTTPLIYERAGDDYVVVASKGGAPQHPGWYRNLTKNPEVEVQVKDAVFPARARVAEGDERARLWALVNQQWPDYDAYQERTDRQIPVVVLELA